MMYSGISNLAMMVETKKSRGNKERHQNWFKMKKWSNDEEIIVCGPTISQTHIVT